MRKRMLDLIRMRQNGLCRFCQARIQEHDEIVSRGRGTRYYYHLSCARQLNII
jgi:hypothetical protein